MSDKTELNTLRRQILIQSINRRVDKILHSMQIKSLQKTIQQQEIQMGTLRLQLEASMGQAILGQQVNGLKEHIKSLNKQLIAYRARDHFKRRRNAEVAENDAWFESGKDGDQASDQPGAVIMPAGSFEAAQEMRAVAQEAQTVDELAAAEIAASNARVGAAILTTREKQTQRKEQQPAVRRLVASTGGKS